MRRYALYPAVSAYSNVDARVSLRVFSSHAITLVDFPRNRGAFGRVVFAYFCANFQHNFVGSNHVILQFKSSLYTLNVFKMT